MKCVYYVNISKVFYSNYFMLNSNVNKKKFNKVQNN